MKNYLIKSKTGNQYFACPIAAHKALTAAKDATLYRWAMGTWKAV